MNRYFEDLLNHQGFVEDVIKTYVPIPEGLYGAKQIKAIVSKLLRFIFREKWLQDRYAQRVDEDFPSFIEKVQRDIGFSYTCNHDQLSSIPKSGPIIFVANHSLGIADSFLLPLIRKVRPDMRMIVNEVLAKLDNTLEACCIPVSMNSKKIGSSSKKILSRLRKGDSVLIFPAGDVSRFKTHQGIEDGVWLDTFYRLAVKTNARIVPIYVDGCPSKLYLSLVNKGKIGWLLAQMLQMFEASSVNDTNVHVTIGRAIDSQIIDAVPIDVSAKVCAIRQQVYALKTD